MGKSSCCCGATPSKPCLCMKQDVMSCSAKAPMCPCYKALAEKKGAEDDFMGFEYYYLVDSDGNKSNDFPSLEEAQIARSYVPNRNLKIMRRRHEGRNMVGKTTEITEFDPYEEQLKNPNYFKNNYRAESFSADGEFDRHRSRNKRKKCDRPYCTKPIIVNFNGYCSQICESKSKPDWMAAESFSAGDLGEPEWVSRQRDGAESKCFDCGLVREGGQFCPCSNRAESFSAEGGSKGEWVRRGSGWESKGFAEMDVENLIEEGYKARLNSTSKPVKTPFGTIKGKRWFAELFRPDGAVDFRRGKWMKLIDKNGGLGLENMTPVEVGEGMNAETFEAEEWWDKINNNKTTERGHSFFINKSDIEDEDMWGTRDGEELFIFSQIPDYYTGTMYLKYPLDTKKRYRESFLQSLELNTKYAKKKLMAEIEENIGKGIWTIEPYMEWFSRNRKWFLDMTASNFDKPNESGWVATTTLTDLQKPLDFVLKMDAESHAYSYAYNDGHSDSRKREEYRPNLSGSRQEADFKKILKQKAEYSRDSDGRFSSKSAISLTTAAIIGLAGAYLWRGKK